MRDDKFAILLDGPVRMSERLVRQVADARLIAADGGMAHAVALDRAGEVELWVGDFDSASPDMIARYGDIERRVHPAAKDATDGELAVNAAIERGATSLVLVGGMGGRTDHAMAHLAMMAGLAGRQIEVMATSGDEEAWPLVAGETTLPLAEGWTLSVIGLTALEGLHLAGVRWPLRGRDVTLGSSLTVSNEVTGEVRVRLKAGCGVAVACSPGRASRRGSGDE